MLQAGLKEQRGAKVMRKHPLVSDWQLAVARSVGRVYRSIGSDGPFKLVAPSEIRWLIIQGR